MGDENGYVSRAEHNEFARRIESSIDQIKEDVNEMGEVVRNMNSLSLSVERMAVSLQNMCEKQKEMGEQLESQNAQIRGLENRDGEKWRQVVGYAITAVISLVLGFLFTNIIT